MLCFALKKQMKINDNPVVRGKLCQMTAEGQMTRSK